MATDNQPSTKQEKKLRPILIITWLLLSLVLVYINWSFYIDDYISHPQFTNIRHWQYIKEMISLHQKSGWVGLYHGFDVIWAGLGLFLIHKTINKNKNEKIWYKPSLTIWLPLFINNIQNLSYLIIINCDPSSTLSFVVKILPIIIICKKVLYSYVILLLLCHLYVTCIKKHLEVIWTFIKANSLNVLAILIVLLLLTQMAQGSALIIILLSNPLNLCIFTFIIISLSAIFSHYPAYLFHYFYKKDHPSGTWKMVSSGLIVYNNEVRSKRYIFLDKQIKPCRYSIGSLWYVTFLYAILYTYQINIDPGFPIHFIILLNILIIHLRSLGILGQIFTSLPIRSLINYLVKFEFSLLCMFFLATLLFSALEGWSLHTFISTSLTIFLGSIYSIKYKMYAKEIFFNFYNNIFNNSKIGSEYELKLNLIRISGVICLVIFILSHIPAISQNINPIILILCYIHLVYGVVIISLKYYFYYSSPDHVKLKILQPIFANLPLSASFLIASYLIATNFFNLHFLEKVNHDPNSLKHLAEHNNTHLQNDTVITCLVLGAA